MRDTFTRVSPPRAQTEVCCVMLEVSVWLLGCDAGDVKPAAYPYIHTYLTQK